jgi:hypothetical protein
LRWMRINADEAYLRLPGRKAAPVRFWEGD